MGKQDIAYEGNTDPSRRAGLLGRVPVECSRPSTDNIMEMFREDAKLGGAPPGASQHRDMIWIPGGTFRMGSDKHYPEETPVHRVTVDGFWIDRTPVTSREFRKFVHATGYVTFAEIKPDPEDYPGALPHMLKAGSLVFTPPNRQVDLRDSTTARRR